MKGKGYARLMLCLALALAMLLAFGLQASAESEPAAPTLTLSATSVVRGELLEVTVGEPTDVTDCQVEVLDSQGDACAWTRFRDAGTAYVGTANLAPGVYGIRTSARVGEGEDDIVYGASQTITVTASPAQEKTVVFRVGMPDGMMLNDFYTVSVYAPGAKTVALYDPNDPTMDFWADKESLCGSFIAQESTTLYAKAYYTDGSTVTVEPQTITGTVLGEIGDVELTVANTVPAGQDLSVGYTLAENEGLNTRVRYELYVTRDDGKFERCYPDPYASSLMIPGSMLEAGHSVDLNLYAYSDDPGYLAKEDKRRIFAVGQTDQNVTMTIGGQTETTLGAFEITQIEISAPGATGLRFYSGEDANYYEELDRWGEWKDIGDMGWGADNENIHFDWGFWRTGDNYAYVTACYGDPDDPDAQWVYGNTVIVHVESAGTLTPPEITLPEQISKGDYLRVAVSGLNPNTEWIQGQILGCNEEGFREWNSLSEGSDGGDGCLYFSTAMLEVGKPYVVCVNANAEGWETSSDAFAWFIPGEGIDEVEQGAIHWDFTKQSYLANESVIFSAYAPGAQYIEIQASLAGNEHERWDNKGGEVFAGNFSWPVEGEAIFNAIVHYSDEDEETKEYFTYGPVAITAPKGSLNEMDVHIPAEVSGTEDLVVEIPAVAHAAGISFEVRRFDADGREETVINQYRDFDGQTSVSFTVPAEELQSGLMYRYHIHQDPGEPGYAWTETNGVFFVVADEDTPAFVLSADKSRVAVNEAVRVECTVEDVTAVCLLTSTGDMRYLPDAHVVEEFRFNESGDQYILAKTTTDEVDWDMVNWGDWDWNQVSWTALSNLVSVHVDEGEQLDRPVTSTPAELPHNELLQVTVPEVDHAQWYQVCLYNQEGVHIMTYDVDGPGEYRLPSQWTGMAPGEKGYVTVSVGGVGYYWTESVPDADDRFEVVEPEDSIKLDLPPQIQAGERFYAFMRAPGASGIAVVDETNGWDGRIDGQQTLKMSAAQEDTGDWDWFDEAGVHTLRLYAVYEEDFNWEDINGMNWQDTGVTATLTVTADVIYTEDELRQLVPSVVPAGQELVIARPENVGWFWLNMNDITDGDEYCYGMNDDSYWIRDLSDEDQQSWNAESWPHFPNEDGDAHIPVSLLQPNHTYRVELGVGGRNVNRVQVSNLLFTVYTPSQHDITVTVNGSDQPQSILLWETATAEVSAPGATAIRLFNGWEWRYELGDSLTWGWSNGDEETISLYAQAYYDPISEEQWYGEGYEFQRELAWEGMSGQVSVTPVVLGTLDTPVFTITNPDAAVEQGKFLNLLVENPDPDAVYQAHVFLTDESGWRDERGDWYRMTDNAFAIPTLQLDPGLTWTVEVYANEKIGYRDTSAQKPFTVTEGQGGQILNFSKYEVQTGEEISYSLRVPNVTAYILSVDEPDNWDGDWNQLMYLGPFENEIAEGSGFRLGRSGTHTLRLYTFDGEFTDEANPYSDYGLRHIDWTRTDTTVTITATADYVITKQDLGRLVPATVPAGQELVIRRPAHVEDFEVRLFDVSSGEEQCYVLNDQWACIRDLSDEDQYGWNVDDWPHVPNEDGNAYIPGELLLPNHSYRVELHVSGRNVEDNMIPNACFLATDGVQRDITLTVDGSTAGKTLPVWQDYEVEVSAPGAAAIRVFDGWNWQYEIGDRGSWVWNSGDDSIRNLYAQAFYGDMPENWNWYELDWEGVSNTVRLELTADGYLPAPVYTIVNPNATVARGDFLELRLTDPDPDARYWAHVGWIDESGNRNWTGETYDLEGDTILLGTANLELDHDWVVAVDGNGKIGYFGSSTIKPFALAPGSETALRVNKVELKPGENFIVSAAVPGAQETVLLVDVSPAHWDGNLETAWHAGPYGEYAEERGLRFYDFGTHYIYLYARYEGESEWTFTERYAELTVADRPYDGPVMQLPSALRVIETEAFANINTHTIVLPEGVSIGNYAFANCSARYVVIPDSVTEIADTAFDGCTNLTIVCNPDTPAAAYAAAHGIPTREP